jgi:RNA polymerase sigma factor (TIGR02999 family)
MPHPRNRKFAGRHWGRRAAIVEPDSGTERIWGEQTDALVVALYPELRSIAHREHYRFGPAQTLQTTALIHETYLKLRRRADWTSRAHFLGCAATAMRHVLIDGARARMAAKRTAPDAAEETREDRELLALGDALEELAALDPELARLVECRFFAGYSEVETAEVLGITERTVRRRWVRARGWIHARMAGD